ncbi:MAG TPA: ATP-NAD kinase family protein [Dongiaceae bacterium]|jgi:predicted polyphosphate/ATP-dependent NAD kinase|nr:ATP-NAD kinase family protein [Dongiaceae bacterium]
MTDRTASPALIGLIVNPIAGMGGRVALKGTDGADILAKARAMGAEPVASQRAIRALSRLRASAPSARLLTGAGPTGAEAATAAGLKVERLDRPVSTITTAEDTRALAHELLERGVGLILFAGGDGTARDILAIVGDRVPLLGIPCGVKMHSAVFAISPEAAGQLAATIVSEPAKIAWRDGEVMDVDEAALREGRLSARLFGYARVPAERNLVQGPKAASLGEDAALAGLTAQIAATLERDTIYLFGPGRSTKLALRHLGFEGTLLGVDAVRNGKLLGRDLTGAEVEDIVDGPRAKIVVSVIGGQGYLFGRGNQQFTPKAIRRVGRENIIVIATQAKLLALGQNRLLVDTGDADLDRDLAGYIRVEIGPSRSTLMRIGFE